MYFSFVRSHRPLSGKVAPISGQAWGSVLLAFDTRLPELELLLEGLSPEVVLLPLSGEVDAIEAIDAALASSGASRLMVLCHGRPGALLLGSRPITEALIEERVQTLSAWKLTAVQLYACHFAADLAMVQRLQELLACPVAASANAVGHPSHKASWDLEWQAAGAITHQAPAVVGNSIVPFQPQALAAWRHQLATLNVGVGQTYTTIQSAIDAASANDTIVVAAGTYEEQININKQGLTLLGPNAGKAGTAGDRVAEAKIRFPSGAVNGTVLVSVAENVNGVTIDGLELECQDATIPNYHYLIRTNKAEDLTIRNNRMYGSEIPIYVLTANNQTVYRQGLLIEKNFIDGGPNVNNSFNRGMYIQATAGTIQDNVIVNSSIGIQYMPYGNTVSGLIQRNTVSSALVGLYHNYQNKGGAPVTWTQNVVTVAPNDRAGLKAQVDGAWTTAVTFRGIEVITFGSEGSGDAPQVTFTENSINSALTPGQTYNSTVLEAVRFTGPYGSGTGTFTSNSFTGWTTAVNNQVAATIPMSGNWWGTSSDSAIQAAITNSGGGGVDFSTFLATGTDSAPSTFGFQADLSSLGVSPLGAQTGSIGRVQEGLNLVAEGGTVNIAAGTYSDGVVTVNTANLTVNAAAGVSGFSFALGSANNLTLAGSGNVDITGNGNDNTLNGNAGANALSGNDGNDTISGGSGADSLDGGAGNDRVIYDSGDVGAAGGADTDTLVVNGAVTIDLSVSADQSSGDTVTVTGFENVDASGSAVAVSITGDNGVNVLQGGAADDTLDGGAGNDTAVFSGNLAAYTFTGTAANFTATGTDGSDTVTNVENVTFDDVTLTTAAIFSPVQVYDGSTLIDGYGTIQAAINAASTLAGFRIEVAAGTYTETVSVNKDVTILGANAGIAGISDSRVAESIVSGGFYVSANGVTLEGLKISQGVS